MNRVSLLKSGSLFCAFRLSPCAAPPCLLSLPAGEASLLTSPEKATSSPHLALTSSPFIHLASHSLLHYPLLCTVHPQDLDICGLAIGIDLDVNEAEGAILTSS